jgi:acyl carrier protein
MKQPTAGDRCPRSSWAIDANLSTVDVSAAYREMRSEELKRAVLDLIIQEYTDKSPDHELSIDTPLLSGGIVDSDSIASLTELLERTFRVRIPAEEATAESFETVESIAKLVDRHSRA